MQSASPEDVKGVLDALDVLFMENKDKIDELNRAQEEEMLAGDSEYREVIERQAKWHGMTVEQVMEKTRSMQMYELEPVDELLGFRASRYPEPFMFTLGIVARQYDYDSYDGVHIHSYPETGLKLDFGYDIPGVHRATVADCEELKRQLGATWVIGLI